MPAVMAYCRAYPDEKGIETLIPCGPVDLFRDGIAEIAEPIPMKRELKLQFCQVSVRTHLHIAEPIPMKRELKQ